MCLAAGYALPHERAEPFDLIGFKVDVWRKLNLDALQ